MVQLTKDEKSELQTLIGTFSVGLESAHLLRKVKDACYGDGKLETPETQYLFRVLINAQNPQRPRPVTAETCEVWEDLLIKLVRGAEAKPAEIEAIAEATGLSVEELTGGSS